MTHIETVDIIKIGIFKALCSLRRERNFMMKKHGFTLAEVLITLAIIGVVATITLPALMSNTQEQQAITAFRKSMNTLNEVGQMNAAVDGFDYSGIATSTEPNTSAVYEDGVLDQSVWGMMVSKAQVDVASSVAGGVAGECDGLNQVFFRDGTVLCYDASTTTNGATADEALINAFIDTNGKKAPNQLSTCDDENCTGANKNIKDQFAITLKGTNALPGNVTFQDGAPIEGDDAQTTAARWAMRK